MDNQDNRKKKALRESSSLLRRFETPNNQQRLQMAFTENDKATLKLLRTLNQNIEKEGKDLPRAKHALGSPPAVLLIGDFEPHSKEIIMLLEGRHYFVSSYRGVQQAMEELTNGRHYRLVLIARGVEHSNALISMLKERGFAYTRLDGSTRLEDFDSYIL
jgi:hypothetical protein